jgi:hypothetical protein
LHRRSLAGWYVAARGTKLLHFGPSPPPQVINIKILDRRQCSSGDTTVTASPQTSIYQLSFWSAALLSARQFNLSYADLLYGGWVQMDCKLQFLSNCLAKLMIMGTQAMHGVSYPRSSTYLRNWQQSLLSWWPAAVHGSARLRMGAKKAKRRWHNLHWSSQDVIVRSKEGNALALLYECICKEPGTYWYAATHVSGLLYKTIKKSFDKFKGAFCKENPKFNHFVRRKRPISKPKNNRMDKSKMFSLVVVVVVVVTGYCIQITVKSLWRTRKVVPRRSGFWSYLTTKFIPR